MEPSISKTVVSKTSVTKTSISKSMVTQTSIRMGNIGTHWCVVDEGGGGRDDPGSSSKDSSISLTPLSLSRGSSSSNKSKMSSLSLSNLRGVYNWFRSNTGVHRGNKRLWVEGWSNKRLWVEGGSNKRLGVEGGSNGETRVSNAESCSISNILNLLELSVGVNIRVSTRNSSISISNLLLDRVDVSVAVVQVAKLILGMELATSSVGSISSIGWSGSSNGSSSNRSSSNRGSSVRKASISSIGKAAIRITISQGGGNDLCLFSQAHGQQSG